MVFHIAITHFPAGKLLGSKDLTEILVLLTFSGLNSSSTRPPTLRSHITAVPLRKPFMGSLVVIIELSSCYAQFVSTNSFSFTFMNGFILHSIADA